MIKKKICSVIFVLVTGLCGYVNNYYWSFYGYS